MKISGYVTDKNGICVEGATIEIKNEKFETLYQAYSNKLGYYEIDAERKKYPFLIGVKDYAESGLEFWCQNIDLTKDISLDLSFDKLEIYGLHVFRVKGGYPSLMIYFRPMSLEKFKLGEKDIAPDLKEINVKIDDQIVDICFVNKVWEFVGDRNLTAYLIQVELPKGQTDWNLISVEITDEQENYGQAKIFNN